MGERRMSRKFSCAEGFRIFAGMENIEDGQIAVRLEHPRDLAQSLKAFGLEGECCAIAKLDRTTSNSWLQMAAYEHPRFRSSPWRPRPRP